MNNVKKQKAMCGVKMTNPAISRPQEKSWDFCKKIKYEYNLYLTKGHVDLTEAKEVA